MMLQIPTIPDLAAEAINRYHADPARVDAAVELINAKMPWMRPAKYDELGNPITPSNNVLAIPGSAGWYTVRKGSCTCQDSHHRHMCKHRIAAWMYREFHTRISNQIPNRKEQEF